MKRPSLDPAEVQAFADRFALARIVNDPAPGHYQEALTAICAILGTPGLTNEQCVTKIRTAFAGFFKVNVGTESPDES